MSKHASVPVTLPNGATLQVRAAHGGGDEDVAFGALSFDGVAKTIEGLAAAIDGALKQAKPKKAKVELGLELAVKSGQLTALLVEGSGKADLTITLEWGE